MKNWLKQPYIWLALFSVVYFFTRLWNIGVLPIFTDEAIYVRWAQIGGMDASWRFISLTDGKQPLYTWFTMIAMRFIKDPLLAGRSVSVAAGLFTMIGMYLVGYTVSRSKRIGIIASGLYLLSPFALFYDRLALYDSLVATCSVWNLYLALLLVRTVRLDVALILGLGLGIGMLNKTSGFLSLYLLPWTLILFDWKDRGRMGRLARWCALVLVAAVLSLVIYSILRLSPYFYIIAQKDTIFVYPFSQWIQHPLQFFEGNIRGMMDWLVGYLTWPVWFLTVLSVITFGKHYREKILLFGWWLFPFVALALFGRVLYPRYILFMVMPLLILASWMLNVLLSKVKHIGLWIVLVGIILTPAMVSFTSILTDIKSAKIPRSEMGQYINDWPSGWGVPEIVASIREESKNGKVSLYTEGTFGLLPYAFEIYLWDNANVDIHGLWPLPSVMPEEIGKSAADHPTYLVMYQAQTAPVPWPLTLVAQYQKGLNPKSTMRLYRVNPPTE